MAFRTKRWRYSKATVQLYSITYHLQILLFNISTLQDCVFLAICVVLRQSRCIVRVLRNSVKPSQLCICVIVFQAPLKLWIAALTLRPSFRQRQRFIWSICCQPQGCRSLRPPALFHQNGFHRWVCCPWTIHMESPDTPHWRLCWNCSAKEWKSVFFCIN